MFVREQIVKRGNAQYRYLKVVENIRNGAATRQKTLVNLGNVEDWPTGKLNEALRLLAAFVGLDISDLTDVEFGDCRQLGPALVLSLLLFSYRHPGRVFSSIYMRSRPL